METDAVAEEQYNADKNYNALDNEYKVTTSEIPYPQTEPYTTGFDYDDYAKLAYEKAQNQPYWDKQKSIKKYYEKGNLYAGHLNLYGSDYYIMDGNLLESKAIKVDDNDVLLINADDKRFADHVKWWRYPSENKDVQFSRNITMFLKRIAEVDIVLDKSSELFSDISDSYLRKALIRNKANNKAQSIIQTIQKKQDQIRSLPKESTFVVQGCAGSGKTMVLLHRLRYLLYNKEITGDEYIFLVPGNNFKEFIDEISDNFNIRKSNILSYQEYYQELVGRKSKPKTTNTDTNELVFSSEYLSRVYSKSFIQESYKTLFENITKQVNTLIELCDAKLNALLEEEKESLSEQLDKTKSTAIESCEELTNKIQQFTKIKIDNNFANIRLLIDEIEAEYLSKKEKFDIAINPDIEITISPDDERILTNEALSELKKNIDTEVIAIEKASIFTKTAHKNKLAQLQDKYNSILEELIERLITEDKQKYASQAIEFMNVYDGFTLNDISEIILKVKAIESDATALIEQTNYALENLIDFIASKYEAEITELNKVITFSGEISNLSEAYISDLIPCLPLVEETIQHGTDLLGIFREHMNSKEDRNTIKSELSLFSSRSDNQLFAYLNNMLFNACKKKINNEFQIKICDIYKHYWYLLLYCNYLTRPAKTNIRNYIFIDEAQDLSVSEIDLIYKINHTNNPPVLNLFGDTNQMITTHGIEAWNKLKFVPTVYTLEENFRNTNQIVDYCNTELHSQMIKIGVDMEPVSEYATILQAVNNSRTDIENPVFIVKDDYAKADLETLLTDTRINNYEIYTVKAAKGLEFKEVFVFDSNMTANEKYISYTRALAKLNVIKFLPEVTDRSKSLIIQEETQEDEITQAE